MHRFACWPGIAFLALGIAACESPTTGRGPRQAKRTPPPPPVIKPATDFAADFAVNGEPVRLADLKGKVVLLDFWAVWCRPCIRVFPHLRDWHKEYKDKGLEIVGLTTYFERVNFDKWAGRQLTRAEEQDMLKAFAAHHRLEHRLVLVSREEMNNLERAYESQGYPHAVLIDRKGIVRMMKTGADPKDIAALDQAIQALIEEQ